jgi:hypothetical protein
MIVKDLFQTTIWISIFAQILTGIIDIVAFFANVPKEVALLKELLLLELVVQGIEGTFYVWLAYYLKTIVNITKHRYYDWFITTPTMLFTFVAYLIYLKERKENDHSTEISLKSIFFDHSSDIFTILSLNAAMLGFGYLGEIGFLNTAVSVVLGFIPFLIYFALIYFHYAKETEQGTQLFMYFAGVWFLYGIAAMFPYYIKNTMYNILDLFAKNFFGVFLAFLVIQASLTHNF